MAKRRTPNYRGLLARPINPWREDVPAAIEKRRLALFAELGVDPKDPSAHEKACLALLKKHRIAPNDGEDPIQPRHRLFALAAAKVPGFRLTQIGLTLGAFYAARRPETRPTDLPRTQIIELVQVVDKLTSHSIRGGVSVKRAINRITETGQPFSHLRHRRSELESAYYRHRGRVPHLFQPLRFALGQLVTLVLRKTHFSIWRRPCAN